jgi:hypothetical protein
MDDSMSHPRMLTVRRGNVAPTNRSASSSGPGGRHHAQVDFVEIAAF